MDPSVVACTSFGQKIVVASPVFLTFLSFFNVDDYFESSGVVVSLKALVYLEVLVLEMEMAEWLVVGDGGCGCT